LPQRLGCRLKDAARGQVVDICCGLQLCCAQHRHPFGLPSKIHCSSKFSLAHLEIGSRGDKVLLSPASARPRMGKPQGDKPWILLQATTLPRAASAFFRSFPRYSNIVPHVSPLPPGFSCGLVCLFVCLFGGSFVVGLGTTDLGSRVWPEATAHFLPPTISNQKLYIPNGLATSKAIMSPIGW
jgi:hypothetical protein